MATTLTPLEIADLLVPRFLAGEVMLCGEVTHEFQVSRSAAQQAVRYARDTLLDSYNVVLPIAHYHGDWLLGITTTAANAFYGEIPQIRALRTREMNLMRRLHGAMALVRSRPRLATKLLKGLGTALAAFEAAVEYIEEFMIDEIEGAAK